MPTDIKKLIAAINPDVYCVELKEKFNEIIKVRKEVKDMIKENYALDKPEKDIYVKVAKQVELVESKWFDLDEPIKDPMAAPGLKNPIEQHTLAYEVSGQSVEQIYFWLHDYLYNQSEYGSAQKILDSFVASPGSSYFSEIGMKATKMQEEAMKILSAINQVVKSVLNITYDLKEFKMRLKIYDNFKSEDKIKRDGALLSLKQVWIDQVDIKKGNSSIKALATGGQNAPNFIMLIHEFMEAKSLEDAKKAEVNEFIRKILIPRYQEFETWLKESERELRKRFELEKTYLKSQYNSLQMYARWVKPYLVAAKALEMRTEHPSAIVNLFETSYFELALLGLSDYKIEADIGRGDLPKFFKGIKMRKYSPIVLVELKFRTYPSAERTQRGGHTFIGRAEVTFTSFSINEDEIALLKDQIEKDNFGDLMELMGGATTESISQLKDDVDEFLKEDEEKEEKPSGEAKETNPFAALLSIIKPKKKKPKEEKEGEKKDISATPLTPDNEYEKVIRSQTIMEGRRKCRKFYDTFKKNYAMPTF